MATLNTSQKFQAALVITNAAGKPAQVDGIPEWASSDETQVTVTASADGMNADIVSVAPSPDGGTARITVNADADLGSGVTPLIGVSEDITVVVDPANQASVMTITLGEPVPKEAAPGGATTRRK
jgi:hypothetical protein